MPVRIEDVQNSKSGKSYRVRLGDQWFGAYLTYKDQPNIMTAVGRMVEVETETKEKVGPWIMAWRFSMDQTLPAGARPITPHQGDPSRHNNPDPNYQGSRPITPHQGAAQNTRDSRSETLQGQAGTPAASAEPARQLSAEELKVVNGIVMAIIEHTVGQIDFKIMSYTDMLENVQLAMKAIAQTVREL